MPQIHGKIPAVPDQAVIVRRDCGYVRRPHRHIGSAHLDLRTRELGPEVERIRAAGGVAITEEPMAEFGFTWQILPIRTATDGN